MKIADWLDNNVASHLVFQEPKLSLKFERDTGHSAAWPTHSVAVTNATVGEFKGLELPLSGDATDRVSYGWEIAAWLEERYAGTKLSGLFFGRGSQFQAALKSLRDKQL